VLRPGHPVGTGVEMVVGSRVISGGSVAESVAAGVAVGAGVSVGTPRPGVPGSIRLRFPCRLCGRGGRLSGRAGFHAPYLRPVPVRGVIRSNVGGMSSLWGRTNSRLSHRNSTQSDLLIRTWITPD